MYRLLPKKKKIHSVETDTMIQKKVMHSSWHSLGISKYLRDFYISSFNDDFKCKPSSANGLRKPGWNFVHKKKPKYCDTSSKISELSYDSAVLHLGIHPEEMNMCPHKTCITVQAGALFMAAPKQTCSTCSSPDKERIVVYPKGVLHAVDSSKFSTLSFFKERTVYCWGVFVWAS